MGKNLSILFLLLFFVGCASDTKHAVPNYKPTQIAVQETSDQILFATSPVVNLNFGRVFHSEVDATDSTPEMLFFNGQLLLAEKNKISYIDPSNGQKKGLFIQTEEEIACMTANDSYLIVATRLGAFDVGGKKTIRIYNNEGELLQTIYNDTKPNPLDMVVIKNTLYLLSAWNTINAYDLDSGELVLEENPLAPRTFHLEHITGNDHCLILHAQGTRYDDILLLYTPDLTEKILSLQSIQSFSLSGTTLYYSDKRDNSIKRYDIHTKQNTILYKSPEENLYYSLYADANILFAARYSKTFDIINHRGKRLLENMPFPIFGNSLITTGLHNGQFAVLSPGLSTHEIELWQYDQPEELINNLTNLNIDPAYPFKSIRDNYYRLTKKGTSPNIPLLQKIYNRVLGDAYVTEINYDEAQEEMNITLSSTKSEYETTFMLPSIETVESKLWMSDLDQIEVRAYFDTNVASPKIKKILASFNGKTYEGIISNTHFISKTAIRKLQEAKQKEEARKKLEAYYARQACRLKHEGWFYESSACKNGLPDGYGKASLLSETVITFEGNIKGGEFVDGTLYAEGVRRWKGAFKDGKPDGKGICFPGSEPERCEFFEGKRIDPLFVQRKEIAELRAKIAEQDAKLQQIENANSQNETTQYQKSTGQKFGEAVVDEVVKRKYYKSKQVEDQFAGMIIESLAKGLLEQLFNPR